MQVWLDAHLSPGLAIWLRETLHVEAFALRDLGLRDATDSEIFAAARQADAVVVTKDADFPMLVQRLGAPPRIVWLTCGNTSKASLRVLLVRVWPAVVERFAAGDVLVEVRDLAASAG